MRKIRTGHNLHRIPKEAILMAEAVESVGRAVAGDRTIGIVGKLCLD